MEEILIKLGFRHCYYAWIIPGSGIYAAVDVDCIHVATDGRPGSDAWAMQLASVMEAYEVNVRMEYCTMDIEDIHRANAST